MVLVWLKRVWRCGETACAQRTWSEPSAAIRARSVLTERARAECALRAGLPDAIVVVDAFHAVRLAQGAIDDVRRRVQQDTLGHRGRKGDPLYGIRRVLLRGAENLTERSYARLLASLDARGP